LSAIIIGLLIFILKKRRRLHLSSEGFMDGEISSPEVRSPPYRTNSGLAFTRSRSATEVGLPMGVILKNIVIGKCLGEGRYGEVFKGVWEETTDVAMKRLKSSSQRERDEFEREASTLQSLSHRNIVQFLGIFQNPEGWFMVMEYLGGGSLETVLHNQRESVVLEDLIYLAKDAAAGMNYLSGMGMIHRDLALRNILISNNPGKGSKYLAKITDFGMARFLETDYYKSEDTEIPVKWTPPEALNFGKFSVHSDVWSYGVLLWEIFTWGERPYASMSNMEASKWVNAGNRLEQPAQCPPEIYEMMTKCWDIEPSQRPSFRDMYIKLNLVLNGPDISPEESIDELEMRDLSEEYSKTPSPGEEEYAKTPGQVRESRQNSAVSEASEVSQNVEN